MIPVRTISSKSRYKAAAFVTLAVGASVALFCVSAIGQNGSAPPKIDREDMKACLACHESEMEGRHPVSAAALAASPHKDLKCQDCHSAITAAPHTPAMLKEKASCGNCHTEQMDQYKTSAHSQPDKIAGDHPTCVTCHGKGDPHAIQADRKWPREKKVGLCSKCHEQRDRMARYGVDSDAVPSYNESFHGKALLRFHNLKVAICTDCHGHHAVLAPTNPDAPTNRSRAAATCSQKGCHVGAKVNFAMSGANHLRLKVKVQPVLRFEEVFFQFLTVGTILFLLGGVTLDLKTKVFTPGPGPRAGRPVAILIGCSFLSIVGALTLAYLRVGIAAQWSFVAALILMALAFLLYFLRPCRTRELNAAGKVYPRFTVAQRIQHGLLAISFTVLVVTGMPLRFANVEWLKTIYLVFGGMAGARIVHRTAAVVMIITWVWHTVYLLFRWKRAGFTFKSWTMAPNLKDISDFVAVSKFYLGMTKDEPKYDRFQFREKFDYFAVYWGMPIMVFSGLVLWFPIYFGNRLPEIGLSAAYIAHSDESVLAFLAIVLWHFYNTHFNPDTFPMSRVFFTGTKTHEEMERDHPLELESLTAKAPDSEPGQTAEREPE